MRRLSGAEVFDADDARIGATGPTVTMLLRYAGIMATRAPPGSGTSTSVVATCLGDPVHRYRVPFTRRR